jgi:hypothetical protein
MLHFKLFMFTTAPSDDEAGAAMDEERRNQ